MHYLFWPFRNINIFLFHNHRPNKAGGQASPSVPSYHRQCTVIVLTIAKLARGQRFKYCSFNSNISWQETYCSTAVTRWSALPLSHRHLHESKRKVSSCVADSWIVKLGMSQSGTMAGHISFTTISRITSAATPNDFFSINKTRELFIRAT